MALIYNHEIGFGGPSEQLLKSLTFRRFTDVASALFLKNPMCECVDRDSELAKRGFPLCHQGVVRRNDNDTASDSRKETCGCVGCHDCLPGTRRRDEESACVVAQNLQNRSNDHSLVIGE